MLPQATASSPAARGIAASMPVVVVLPFVPVTATYGDAGRAGRRVRSRPARGAAARAAHERISAGGGTPGLGTTRSRRRDGRGRGRPRAPRSPRRAASAERRPVARPTRSRGPSRPPRAGARRRRAGHAGADHDQRSPSNAPSLEPQAAAADEVRVEQPEPHRDAHPGHDPEPHDHRDLGPAASSKWWWIGAIRKIRRLNRGTRRPAAITDMRLDHEQPAEDDEQQLGVRDDRERAPSARRARASRCRP